MERGLRKISKEQVVKLASFFRYDEKKMLLIYLSDRIIYEIGEEKYAVEALNIAEKLIEYKTFTPLDRKQIITKIIQILKQFPKVSKAWLYGSFSRKDDGPESDIDIALKTDEGFSYFDLAEIKYQLEEAVKRKFDLGFIDSFKPSILETVKNDLEVIYERQ
jgi:predicted nucleotidyltransferase